MPLKTVNNYTGAQINKMTPINRAYLARSSFHKSSKNIAQKFASQNKINEGIRLWENALRRSQPAYGGSSFNRDKARRTIRYLKLYNKKAIAAKIIKTALRNRIYRPPSLTNNGGAMYKKLLAKTKYRVMS